MPAKAAPNRRDSQKEQAALKASVTASAGKVVDISDGKKSAAKKPPAKKAAKAPPAKKAAKAPAAKAPARPPRSITHPRFTRGKYKAKEGETLYQATSRAGKINVRGSAKQIKYAFDVADSSAPREDQRAGLIWGFTETKEAAEKIAARLIDKGYDVKIVTATVYVPPKG
jgi:hypothetical protein